MGNIILLNYPTFSSLVDKIFEVVAFGNADALKELLGEAEKVERKAALVNARTDYEALSVTPLMEAASSGEKHLVKILLAAGAKVDEVGEGELADRWTSLHYAAYGGHTAVVKLLVEGGAVLDKKDSRNTTPLMLAVDERNYKTVAYLRKKGASLTAVDDFGRNALDLAEEIEYVEVREKMLEILLPSS